MTDPRQTERYGREPLGADDFAFVLCVERNRLEPQALLLCESLRTFGGRFANAPIFAVSPRPALAIGKEARARFEELDVTLVVESLNETGSPYGTINRIVVGAWAEAALGARYLGVLDSDMILVAEPRFVRADVGVRPVDLKGSATSGLGDSFDPYWRRLAELGGVDLFRLPFLTTTIDGRSIRASYNGGFALVRKDLGVLAATRRIFFASLSEGLRPRAGEGIDILASTGTVGLEASEWWGSSQAALSLAIWSKTSDVHVYDERYNIPLHLLTGPERRWPLGASLAPDGDAAPILLHVHYLAEAQYRDDLRGALDRVGCSGSIIDWIEKRLWRFDSP